ncbi:CHC2 zinc finger domain-containing protein [Pelagicoccus sp. SDUM812002]|uniref:CHC2 zinc finger domain-containing protein n=1 Tax=Pelagicoccus sp. SDUM812002 TaxID=3041266 RepID=UPI00280E367E|nr:CHC2 zinc finger domain-containing protein [Pelagicoccus sp. SDUM812002]MDQ8186813.1 CHC2 zinc finger domain-containing protein [Pelagicoccus sp. SDUM812002]
MGKYVNKDSVLRIKKAVEICDHIQSQFPLRRDGELLRGCSPFCGDPRNQCLAVDRTKQRFRCERTGIAGDVIEFEMRSNGIEFVEAVEMLALEYDVYIEYGRTRGFENRRRLNRQ